MKVGSGNNCFCANVLKSCRNTLIFKSLRCCFDLIPFEKEFKSQMRHLNCKIKVKKKKITDKSEILALRNEPTRPSLFCSILKIWPLTSCFSRMIRSPWTSRPAAAAVWGSRRPSLTPPTPWPRQPSPPRTPSSTSTEPDSATPTAGTRAWALPCNTPFPWRPAPPHRATVRKWRGGLDGDGQDGIMRRKSE